MELLLKDCIPTVLFPAQLPMEPGELVHSAAFAERDFGCVGERLDLFLKLEFPTCEQAAAKEIEPFVNVEIVNIELEGVGYLDAGAAEGGDLKLVWAEGQVLIYGFAIEIPPAILCNSGNSHCKFQILFQATAGKFIASTLKSATQEHLERVQGEHSLMQRALVKYSRLVQCSLPIVCPINVQVVKQGSNVWLVDVKCNLKCFISRIDGVNVLVELEAGQHYSKVVPECKRELWIEVAVGDKFLSLSHYIAPAFNALEYHEEIGVESVKNSQDNIYSVHYTLYNHSYRFEKQVQFSVAELKDPGEEAYIPLEREYSTITLKPCSSASQMLQFYKVVASEGGIGGQEPNVSLSILPGNRRYVL